MKRIKLIIIALFILFITGCDGSYEIEIYKNKVTETTYAWYENSELNDISAYDKTLEISSKYDDNGDFLTHDTKKEVKDNGKSGVKLIRKYKTITDFKENSMILGSCYVATSLTNYEDYITLKTTEEFTCFNDIEEFENIEVKVKTNHKVKEHNADKKKGHTYYWYINKDNYKNKPISIKMHKDKYVFNYDNEIIKRLFLISSVVGGTVLVITFTYKIYNKNKKDINKI